MNRYSFVAAEALQWLVPAVGVVVLLARRRRAPRAVAFALPLVLLLTVSGAYMPLRLLAGWTEPPWLVTAVSFGRTAVLLAAFVLLPVAAMSDRHREDTDAR